MPFKWLKIRGADPHSFHPDPDPAFWAEKLQLKKNFFWIKTTIYLSLGLRKERPSY
jgi:hypothetical protein